MTDGLRIESLTLNARDAHGRVRPVVADFGAEFVPGALVALLADDLATPSALLAALAGLRRWESGNVLLDGQPLLPPSRIASPERVGYVDAAHTLPGGLTPLENLAVVLLTARVRRSQLEARATHYLEAVGLPESSRHNLVEQLSGGQQQRVAVARALCPRPRLLLLDDPTSELDPTTAGLIASTLRKAADDGAIILVSTDDPELLDVCRPVELDARYRPRRALG